MGHDCCRPPQLRFVGLQFLFSLIPKVTLLTQLHLGLLHFRPALRGFEFRSLSLAKFPHHHPFKFRLIEQRQILLIYDGRKRRYCASFQA